MLLLQIVPLFSTFVCIAYIMLSKRAYTSHMTLTERLHLFFSPEYCMQQQVIQMLGDWEESKRLIMKHLFNDC